VSRWYKGAIACAFGFALSWVILPEYVRKDGLGAVYRSEVGIGMNWRDADGNPLHDAQGNAIKPFIVRTVALCGFGAGAVILFAAGFLLPGRKRAAAAPLNSAG
jgi:hypothetical protein